jgi:FkbM family methyltransferase
MASDSVRETLTRLNTTRLQIGWFRFLRLLAYKSLTHVFDPYLIPSYSQFGEDRLIEAFFSTKPSGFYIDVGCNHPVSYSNTWKLYLRGWRGIAIDPNPDLILLYRKTRPRDIAIQNAISDKPGLVDFYFSRNSTLISGIGPKPTGHWRRTCENADIVKCESTTLDNILTDYAVPKSFDILTIDVEGGEIGVLNSIDFGTYSPKLMIIEMHDFTLSRPEDNAVYLKATSHGYDLISYVPPTGFFARPEPG